MFLYTIIIFIVLPTLFFVVFFFRRRKPLNSPPSPPKRPIFGNLLQLGTLPHRNLKTLADTYGPIMMLHLGSKKALVVSSSDVAREIFENHDIAFSNRISSAIIDILLYNGKDLVSTPYSKYWREMRTIFVTRLLSSNKVQSFRSVREEEISSMLSKIEAAGSNPVNLSELFSIFTNDVVCRVAFGKPHEAEKKKMMQALDEASQLVSAFDVAEYVPMLAWINYFNGMKSHIRKVYKEVDFMMEQILDEHTTLKTNENEKDFVDILLEAHNEGGSVDKDSVKGMILDVFFGGTETTKTTMEWMMIELLRNPEVMKKVKEEIREATGEEKIAKEEDLRRLKYTKAVIKEAMRMHPAVPIIPLRQTRERVEVRGYEIEENTAVIVNLWAIAMDPTVWEEPGEFRPERFMEKEVDYLGNDYEFIPFGAGRRRCPGIAFAASVIEIGIVTLLKNFDISLGNGKKVDISEAAGLSVHPKSPLVVNAHPM